MTELNGNIEKQRLKWLIANPYPIIYKFLEHGINIKDLKEKGGRQSYDLTAINYDGQEENIEVKGYTKNKSINKNVPWENISPQFLNAGMFCMICYSFASNWYNILPSLKERYNIECDLPSFSEWLELDGKYQGSCRSSFGKALKNIYKQNKNNESYIKNLCYQILENTFNSASDQDKNDFEEKLLTISNKALSKKKWWLACKYNSKNDLNPLELTLMKGTTIKSIKIDRIENNGCGPRFITIYYTEKNPNIKVYGEARLRFRNTTGIANIGWGIK
jgi:hypothetical protein